MPLWMARVDVHSHFKCTMYPGLCILQSHSGSDKSEDKFVPERHGPDTCSSLEEEDIDLIDKSQHTLMECDQALSALSAHGTQGQMGTIHHPEIPHLPAIQLL